MEERAWSLYRRRRRRRQDLVEFLSYPASVSCCTPLWLILLIYTLCCWVTATSFFSFFFFLLLLFASFLPPFERIAQEHRVARLLSSFCFVFLFSSRPVQSIRCQVKAKRLMILRTKDYVFFFFAGFLVVVMLWVLHTHRY